MKNGVEVPHFDNPEKVDNPEKGKTKPKLETFAVYEERNEKILNARLRGDFAARVDGLREEFEGVEVHIAGEKYTFKFTALLKDGKRAEKTEDLKKEAEDKNFNLDRISGQFTLVATGEKKENLNLIYTLPIKTILACDTRAALKRLITDSFGGTDEYYKKLKASAQKETPTPRVLAERAEKREAKIKKIKKAAEAAKSNVSTLEGENFTSVIVRIPTGTQFHFTSTDMAVWNVAEVNNGKLTGKTTTENPLEFIKPAETEPNA